MAEPTVAKPAINPYASIEPKRVFSTPSRGSKTKPASSAPDMAPSVLARVSLPAVSAASPHSSRCAAPSIVNRRPERTEVGSIRRKNSDAAPSLSSVVNTTPSTWGSNTA